MADNETENQVLVGEAFIRKQVEDALAARGQAPTEFKCDNGLTLGLRPVPRALVAEAINRHNRKRPQPPIIREEPSEHFPEGREILNETSPAYLDALERFNAESAQVGTAIYLGLGTYIKDAQQLKKLGLEGPDDESWLKALLEFVPDLDEPERGSKARYIAWLQYYALTDTDNTLLSATIMGYYGGTREEAVKESMDSFRDTVRGGTDNGSGDSEVERVSTDQDRA